MFFLNDKKILFTFSIRKGSSERRHLTLKLEIYMQSYFQLYDWITPIPLNINKIKKHINSII